jgi:hypothetical protein
MATEWLIDRTRPLAETDIDDIDRELAGAGFRSRGGRRRSVPFAVTLHDMTIFDNKRWFGGEANIRLDALVVTGYGDPSKPNSFYMPKTTTFSRVGDGDTLPIGPGGLLMFHGPGSHFLDVSILVSRDRKDTKDLADLIAGTMGSAETAKSFSALLGLAVAAPQVAVVTGAIEAASKLADTAFRVLQAATGNTIGLYHNCHLEYRDGFGIGRHPGPGTYRVKDMSFWYEIGREGPSSDAAQDPVGEQPP